MRPIWVTHISPGQQGRAGIQFNRYRRELFVMTGQNCLYQGLSSLQPAAVLWSAADTWTGAVKAAGKAGFGAAARTARLPDRSAAFW